MKSIKGKILLVVIAGLLVITATVSAIGITMTHEIMHKDADRILNNVTLKEAAYINDVLGDVKKSANIMEEYVCSEISDLSQLKNAEFYSTYIQKTKKMFTEIALNTSGVEGFFFRLNPKYTNNVAGFYNLVNEDLTIKEMPVTDLSKYPKDDVKNVGWYYKAIKEGKGTWLEPYFFPGHNKQLISYVIPMYINSELLGVVGFDMDFESLVNSVSDISVYEKGYAVLLASDGKTQYNKVDVEASNEPHTKATATLQNGMYLELRADYKDIQKDIHPVLANIIIAFIVVLIVAIIYTIIVTEKIVNPLKLLTESAKKISTGINDGKLEIVEINTNDEIGVLSKVLNDAYGKIQEYTIYINALAYRDSLTGIKNSTAYTEAVKKLNDDINCSDPRFGVLVVDINNLKYTNDTYGHDVGNELIIHTANILTSIFANSSVFRIGGDEFAVILKDDDYKQYRSLIKKLDETCSKDYITVCENNIPVFIARGVASFDTKVDRVYEDVFSKADHAMYLNKEESKAALAGK